MHLGLFSLEMANCQRKIMSNTLKDTGKLNYFVMYILTIDIFKFRITREYMFQSEAFLQRMRDKMNTIRNSDAFIQYNRRYENLLKEKFIAEANRTKQINFYFLNTYDIVVMLRQVRYRKGSFRNGWK